MKTTFLFVLFFVSSSVFSQSFKSYDFYSEGFPVTAAFPSRPAKKVNTSKNDTLLSANDTRDGVTYLLVVTRTGSQEIASGTAQSVLSKLIDKASRYESPVSSSVNGISSSYLKYVTSKNVYVIAQVFSFGRMMIQASVLKENSYAGSTASAFFNSINFQQGSSFSNTSSQHSNYSSQSNNDRYEENSRVEVWDAKTSKWYGAIILKAYNRNLYRVSFDGYAETYDEDVTSDRIRKMSTATILSFVPYINTKKGKRTKFEGRLENGKFLEDLSWATSSQIACWPSIRDVEFQGKHVGYWFDLPDHSVATITVTPKHSNSRINIYGYTSFDLQRVPPNITYAQSCEASHPTWVGEPNFNEPAKPQSIQLNTVSSRTMVYFAVAGAKNITSGEYTVTIEIK